MVICSVRKTWGWGLRKLGELKLRETMTEEQNGNGRRPMFVETTDHPLSEGYGQRTWRIRHPREWEPVKIWKCWFLGGVIFVGGTIVCLRFIVLPTRFL